VLPRLLDGWAATNPPTVPRSRAPSGLCAGLGTLRAAYAQSLSGLLRDEIADCQTLLLAVIHHVEYFLLKTQILRS
jgi:hypothetical protein